MATHIQIKPLAFTLVLLVQLAVSSARSVSQKHALSMPSAASSKHALIKDIMTSSQVKHNMTSLVDSDVKGLKHMTSQEGQPTGVTSQRSKVNRAKSQESEMRAGSERITSALTSSDDISGETMTSGDVSDREVISKGSSETVMSQTSNTSKSDSGNVTLHSTSGRNTETKSADLKTLLPEFEDDGCSNHRCSSRSRCDSSEGIVHDTGLPYMCRCPRDYYGIFCTIPRAEVCLGCTGPGLYCHRTGMHWSGHFCYNTTNSWARIGTDWCGGRDFTCDGGFLCVPPVELCDGVPECQDEADERAPWCSDE